jgi:hypothetical protein
LLPAFPRMKPSSLFVLETTATRSARTFPCTLNVPVAMPKPLALTMDFSVIRAEPFSRVSLLVDVPVNFPRFSVMDTLPLVHVRVLTVPLAVKCADTDVKLLGFFPSATAMPVTISAAATVARTPSFKRRMSPSSVVSCRCGKHDAESTREVVKVS